MNINFTQSRNKLIPKFPISHIWKATAFIAVSIAIGEGYWIYHSNSAKNKDSLTTISRNENVQFVGAFSQRMSNNTQTADTLKIDNQVIIAKNDSVKRGENAEVSAVTEGTDLISSPYQLQLHQTEQTKEQLTAWLKQNMALVNDLRKVMYRIEYAKQKHKQVKDSLLIIHPSLTIIEDSIVLWKVRANVFDTEVADNQSKKAVYALQKQELEWQNELKMAKERSTLWQSILHQYNEKWNLYK